MTEEVFTLRRIEPDDGITLAVPKGAPTSWKKETGLFDSFTSLPMFHPGVSLMTVQECRHALLASKAAWPSLLAAIDGKRVLDISSKPEHAVYEFKRTVDLVLEYLTIDNCVLSVSPNSTISFISGGSIEFCDLEFWCRFVADAQTEWDYECEWDIIDGYLLLSPDIRHWLNHAAGITVF